MIMGIVVTIVAIAGIGVFSVLKHLDKWHHKQWPIMLGLSLLAAGGILQSRLAQTQLEQTASLSATKTFVNKGKLALNGKIFTADFDDDDTATIKLAVKVGDRVIITDTSGQNQDLDDTQLMDETVAYAVYARDEPAKLHLKLIHQDGYKTANVTVLPDPDRDAKYADSSSKQAVADSRSASESVAASQSIAASESQSAAKSVSESKVAEASWSQSVSIEQSQSIAASSKAAAESAAAEANKYNTGITYEQIAREPDTYMGRLLHLTGKVIQVIEGETQTDLRVAIDGNYNNVVLVVYDPTTRTTRILEDDKVTFYGLSLGTQSYTSTLGASITVPLVQADKIDDSGTAPTGYGY